MSGDQVLEFEAVGSHLLLRLAANSCHVAVLHLTGAAAGPGVDAHSERLAWEPEGEEVRGCSHIEKMEEKQTKKISKYIKSSTRNDLRSPHHLDNNFTCTSPHMNTHIAVIAIVH